MQIQLLQVLEEEAMGRFGEVHSFVHNQFQGRSTTIREINQKIEEGGLNTRFYEIVKNMILECGDPDVDRIWLVTTDWGIKISPGERSRRSEII